MQKHLAIGRGVKTLNQKNRGGGGFRRGLSAPKVSGKRQAKLILCCKYTVFNALFRVLHISPGLKHGIEICFAGSEFGSGFESLGDQRKSLTFVPVRTFQ